MSRRYISAILAIAALAVLTVHATEFWADKEWKQWSKAESAGMLVESPWSHVWRDRTPAVLEASTSNGTSPTPVNVPDLVVYDVQLRSALPIREAIVRELQFDQKYDKMKEEDRKAFDAQAGQILNRNYDDSILIHVDYSKSQAVAGLAGTFHAVGQDGIKDMDIFLMTDDEVHVKAIRFDPKGDGSFDVIFPRTKEFASEITDGRKHLSFQFVSPQIITDLRPLGIGVGHVRIAKERVRVEFDLTKMVVDGTLVN